MHSFNVIARAFRVGQSITNSPYLAQNVRSQFTYLIADLTNHWRHRNATDIVSEPVRHLTSRGDGAVFHWVDELCGRLAIEGVDICKDLLIVDQYARAAQTALNLARSPLILHGRREVAADDAVLQIEGEQLLHDALPSVVQPALPVNRHPTFLEVEPRAEPPAVVDGVVTGRARVSVFETSEKLTVSGVRVVDAWIFNGNSCSLSWSSDGVQDRCRYRFMTNEQQT